MTSNDTPNWEIELVMATWGHRFASVADNLRFHDLIDEMRAIWHRSEAPNADNSTILAPDEAKSEPTEVEERQDKIEQWMQGYLDRVQVLEGSNKAIETAVNVVLVKVAYLEDALKEATRVDGGVYGRLKGVEDELKLHVVALDKQGDNLHKLQTAYVALDERHEGTRGRLQNWIDAFMSDFNHWEARTKDVEGAMVKAKETQSLDTTHLLARIERLEKLEADRDDHLYDQTWLRGNVRALES